MKYEIHERKVLRKVNMVLHFFDISKTYFPSKIQNSINERASFRIITHCKVEC